jgi:hypothetical protein
MQVEGDVPRIFCIYLIILDDQGGVLVLSIVVVAN